MKNILSLFCAITLMATCAEKKKALKESEEKNALLVDTVADNTLEPIAVKPDGSYFKAIGTEPFWGLKLEENSVQLSTMEDTIFTPSIEPIKPPNSKISMYRIETEASKMDIIIAQKECVNAMSGEKSPYTVTIAYKKTDEEETQIFEGCGAYITDYRLHDIWVLQNMKGKAVSKSDFNGKDVPNMEININKNRFSGFSGCNSMTGGLFFEKDVLRFINIASTRKACPNSNEESGFLKALQDVSSYRIKNKQLHLFNNEEIELLVFKKTN